MTALVIYSSLWNDLDAYMKWCMHREDVKAEVHVKLMVSVDVYCQIIKFDTECDAALFKLCWGDKVRLERYVGIL